MIIAVNTRILSGDTRAGKFLLDTLVIIAAGNPAHQFVFITENDLTTIPVLANVKKIVIKQQTNSSLLWKLWYNYKLPSTLRKASADVLLSANGVCSLRTKVPQCLMVNDIDFIHHPEWYDKKYLSFIRLNIAACLQKATSIITLSAHTKNEIIGKYKTGGYKIATVYPGASNGYQPINSEAREAIKEKYADGKEYFLFNGAIHAKSNLVNLLKAFSIFKKRQKSSMHLIIATAIIPEKDTFIESLRLYKYRSELKILAGLDETEIHPVTAAAYSCINLSPSGADINILLNSMQSAVPVIAGNNTAAKEILGDAALYANPSSFEAIAEQLMLLYKDENKRNELIKKGIELASKYTADKTAQQLWQKILAAASQ